MMGKLIINTKMEYDTRKREFRNSAMMINQGNSPTICGCRIYLYIPLNISVSCEGLIVSFPASLIPCIKIAVNGVAMITPNRIGIRGFGCTIIVSPGMGNHAHNIIWITRIERKNAEKRRNRLQSFQAFSPTFSSR